jgi:hypothetical protein
VGVLNVFGFTSIEESDTVRIISQVSLDDRLFLLLSELSVLLIIWLVMQVWLEMDPPQDVHSFVLVRVAAGVKHDTRFEHENLFQM